MPDFILVDNGSLRPEAYLNLKRIAAGISAATGEVVYAAPLLHANKIDPDLVGGKRVRTFAPLAKGLIAAGQSELVAVPLFFGPSGALTSYLPERIQTMKDEIESPFCIHILRSLVDAGGASVEGIGSLLLDHFEQALAGVTGRVSVVLVDHGSPKAEVAAVRNRVGAWLEKRIQDRVHAFSVASMERRAGEAYDFNEPMLEGVMKRPGFQNSSVIVLPLFLSPGRHAGPGGDIESIARASRKPNCEGELHFAALVGEHAGLIELLSERVKHWRDWTDWSGPSQL